MVKSRYGCEAHRSGEFRINFDHLESFSVHPMHSTRVLLHSTPLGMQPLQPVPDLWPGIRQRNVVVNGIMQRVQSNVQQQRINL